MAKRSLSCYRLIFHERNKPNVIQEPGKLGTHGLIHYFEKWLTEVHQDDLNLEKENLQIRIKQGSLFKEGNCILGVTVEGGVPREPGPIVNIETLSDTGIYISEDEAPFGGTRFILFVPESGAPALAFCESSRRGNGAYKLFRKFIDHWRRCPAVANSYVKYDEATRSKEWLEAHGELKELTIKRYVSPRFYGDRVREDEAKLLVKLVPLKSKRWPIQLLSKIKNNRRLASEFMHLAPANDDENEKIFATVDLENGRQRQLEINDNERGFPVFEELNDDLAPSIPDNELLQVCKELAEEYYDQLSRG